MPNVSPDIATMQSIAAARKGLLRSPVVATSNRVSEKPRKVEQSEDYIPESAIAAGSAFSPSLSDFHRKNPEKDSAESSLFKFPWKVPPSSLSASSQLSTSGSSVLTTEATTPDSARNTGSGKRTLFFIDWDDTLFPTFWLRDNYYLTNNICEMQEIIERSGGAVHLPQNTTEILKLVERAAADLLRKCCTLGEVIIVSNSSEQWIPFTAKHYMPGILPLLESIPFHSARPTLLSQRAAGLSSTLWKAIKFKDLADTLSEKFCSIVSIGDGCAERNAVLELKNFYKNCCCKAVRFKLQPDIKVVRQELQILTEHIGDIIAPLDQIRSNLIAAEIHRMQREGCSEPDSDSTDASGSVASQQQRLLNQKNWRHRGKSGYLTCLSGFANGADIVGSDVTIDLKAKRIDHVCISSDECPTSVKFY